jgi:hypothetical protein
MVREAEGAMKLKIKGTRFLLLWSTTIISFHPVASRQIVTKTEHSSQSFVALVD